MISNKGAECSLFAFGVQNKLESEKLQTLVNTVYSFSSAKRYSNKTLLKNENIAEHSSIVGIVVLYLYDMIDDAYKPNYDINRMLAYTIFHDFDEIFTGDLLNPVKYYKVEIKDAVNEYAEKCMEKFSKKFKVLADYWDYKHQLPLHEAKLIKLADIISVFIKITIERAMGNTLLNLDYSNLGDYLKNNHEDLPPRLSEFIKLIINDCDSIIPKEKENLSNYFNLKLD